MPLNFDAVVVAAHGLEAARRMGVEEFLDMPLGERVQLVVQRRLSFYAGARQVDTRDALRSLREHSRA